MTEKPNKDDYKFLPDIIITTKKVRSGAGGMPDGSLSDLQKMLDGLFDSLWAGKNPADWKIKTPTKEPVQTAPLPREAVLRPLDSIFIDDALKDDIITRTAIPDLLEGKEPAYSGVILYGPPGTGKTVLLRAIRKVYRAAGAFARDVSVSSINSAFVGSLAGNLESYIVMALEKSNITKKPSFLSFDEASVLAQNAAEGSTSVSKHYQEAIDVLKRYVGYERNLVVAISTNLLSESFEDALTREGRLTSFFIGYPKAEQRKRMWKHFAEKNKIMSLTDEQAGKLAKAVPAEQGAFIEEFARNYLRARRSVLLKETGYNTLVDALKQDANISEEDVISSITFDNLFDDLTAAIRSKYDRLKEERKHASHSNIGFYLDGSAIKA